MRSTLSRWSFDAIGAWHPGMTQGAGDRRAMLGSCTLGSSRNSALLLNLPQQNYSASLALTEGR
jgi:hypothetical protein